MLMNCLIFLRFLFMVTFAGKTRRKISVYALHLTLEKLKYVKYSQ